MSNVTVSVIPARRRYCAVRKAVAWLLAGMIGSVGVTQAAGEPICRPALRVTKAHLSEMRPPTLERRWTAIVAVDASRCASTAGYFEIGISRMKEYGGELEFRERFIWSSPAVTVSVDFAADEAVETYRIDGIQACPCAAVARGSSGLLPTDRKPN